MIVFYTENFKLNFSDIKLKLIEQNSLFFDYMYKKHSMPFTINVDSILSKNLGFIDLPNSKGYEVKYNGQLYIENNFEPAMLILKSIKQKKLQGVIYYGGESIAVFDKELSLLPFPTVNTGSITEHAKSVITKQYPEVSYNFPMIIDRDIRERSRYEKFEGIINHLQNGNYVTNYIQNTTEGEVVYNRNVMVPYPYLYDILKVGFETEGKIITGDFANDVFNKKILVVTDHLPEKFYSGLPENFNFKRGVEVWEDNIVTGTFSNSFYLRRIGAFEVDILLNIPSELEVQFFRVSKGSDILLETFGNYTNQKLKFTISSEDDYSSLSFKLELKKNTTNSSEAIGDISNYNSIGFGFSNGVLNEFPTSFNLTQLMPEMKFGAFFNKIVNIFNLDVTFKNNQVNLDYIEDKLLKLKVFDESNVEEKQKTRYFNHKKYVLKNGSNELVLGKDGFITRNDIDAYDDLNEISMDASFLELDVEKGVTTGMKTDDSSSFKLVLYDGLQDGLPVTPELVNGRKLNLMGIYERLWKNWLRFRMSSEEYKDRFKTASFYGISIDKLRYKYNSLQLYKRISRTKQTNDTWLFEVESECF